MCVFLPSHTCYSQSRTATTLTGIHKLRYKAHILHRDISVDNIMYNVKDGCFILNDFDLAARLKKGGFPINPSDSTPSHRTGTLPFMARDLVEAMATTEQTKIIHTVRHDLESVFWVALWCSVYVVEPNLAEQGALTWKEHNEFLSKLETGSHDTIFSKKIAIILDAGTRMLSTVPFSPSFSAMRGWLDVFRSRLEEGLKAAKVWKSRQANKARRRGEGLKAGEEQEGTTDTWDAKTLKRYEEGYSEITCSKLKEAFDAYENPPPAPESDDSEVDIEEVQEESEDDWSQDE